MKARGLLAAALLAAAIAPRAANAQTGNLLRCTVHQVPEDGLLATCAGRFANAVNFRGEPHLPGMDLLTRYPGA